MEDPFLALCLVCYPEQIEIHGWQCGIQIAGVLDTE